LNKLKHILISILLPTFCFGQYSETFSKFIPSDSIKAYVDGWQAMGSVAYDYPIKTKKFFPIRMISQKIEKGTTYTEFKIGPKTLLTVGIKNGKFMFPKNKNNQFGQEIDYSSDLGSSIKIYPFNKDYRIILVKYEYIPNMESVLHLRFIPKSKILGLKIREMIIYSDYGLNIEFQDDDNTYYTDCC